MQTLTRRSFVLFFFYVSASRHVYTENSTKLNITEGRPGDDITDLPKAVAVLNALSTTQKEMLEQQGIREERALFWQKEIEEKVMVLTKALDAQQQMLEEIRGKNSAPQSAAVSVITPKDCSDIYLDVNETSGVYTVWPFWNRKRESFPVYCDMDTDGGGWTVIMRWTQASVSKGLFDRPWDDYKNGFGDMDSLFWLGNDRIHELTSQGAYELRLEIQHDNNKSHCTYGRFFIEGEAAKYKLHVGDYHPGGSARDVFSYDDDTNFLTYEQPIPPDTMDIIYKDPLIIKKTLYLQCAKIRQVGWWFERSCGIFLTLSQLPTKTEMMIRHTSFLEKKKSSP